MKKETQNEKSLRLLQKYLNETSREQFEKDVARLTAMDFEGPTVDEYFDGLQRTLQKWTRSLTKES
jgi:hypothetical protein